MIGLVGSRDSKYDYDLKLNTGSIYDYAFHMVSPLYFKYVQEEGFLINLFILISIYNEKLNVCTESC